MDPRMRPLDVTRIDIERACDLISAGLREDFEEFERIVQDVQADGTEPELITALTIAAASAFNAFTNGDVGGSIAVMKRVKKLNATHFPTERTLAKQEDDD